MKLSFLDNQVLKNRSHNFTNETNVHKIYDGSIENIYEANSLYTCIFLTALFLSSLIGSIANLSVICILQFIFNKKFNRSIQSKITAASSFYIHRVKKITDEEDSARKIKKLEIPPKQIQVIELYENYNRMKRKIIFSSNMILFYKLLSYLATVDFLASSFTIPVTIYEIRNNVKINYHNCKIFEYIRSFGVITSNFIITLIAMERYIVLYQEKNLSKNSFKFRIIFSLIFSALLSLPFVFEVNMNGKREINSLNFTGTCLISNNQWIHGIIKKIICLTMTIGVLYVVIVYVLVLKKTISKKSLAEVQHSFKIKIYKNTAENSIGFDANFKELNKPQLKNKNNIKETSKESKSKSYSSLHVKRNRRFTISILFVTLTYYASIIPWYLMMYGKLMSIPHIQYIFLLNNALNPFMYCLLDQNFRKCGLYLTKLCSLSTYNKFIKIYHR